LKPLENIRDMKSFVSDIVGRTMADTFDTMFSRDITGWKSADGLMSGDSQDICSRVTLAQGGMLVEFRFQFAQDLLLTIAKESYSVEALKLPIDAICEDMACAVANVVGSRVKAFLNGRGFDFEMDIPVVAKTQNEPSNDEGTAHLNFRCHTPQGDDGAIVVNIRMQEQAARA
jgi:CheY-specific phosphatase CheX